MTAELILVSIGILLVVLFSVPIIALRILNSGNVFGNLLGCIFLIYGIFFKEINAFLIFLSAKTYGKIILICFFLFLLAIFIFAIIITLNIILKANRHTNQPTTVVVLGCRVRKDGASTMLKTRLYATLDYLKKHSDTICILSGGKGHDEHIAESDYMLEWLVQRGIDKKRLFTENKSTSTEENIKYSKEIIRQYNLTPEITIITNEFHQFRAYRFAKLNGIESYSYSARTPFFMFPTYFVREILGVAHMIFIGRNRCKISK